MAKLGKPVAGDWSFDGPDAWKRHEAQLRALETAASALPEGEVVGALLCFPRGDGSAIYRVSSAKTLTLQHVPFGDAWTYPGVTDLSLTTVRKMVARERAWKCAITKA